MTIADYNPPEPYLHLLRRERHRIRHSGMPKNQKKKILDLLSEMKAQRFKFEPKPYRPPSYLVGERHIPH